MSSDRQSPSNSDSPAATPAATPALTGWLQAAIEHDASDLHLVTGHPPVIRQHGRLQTLTDQPLTADTIDELLRQLVPGESGQRLQRERNLDLSLELTVNGQSRRLRVNCFFSAGGAGLCLRIIPAEIPSFTWAGFPHELAERIVRFRNGLVLFTGVTGAGKTTSLAMVLDLMNQQGNRRIITVEEPVEYVFPRRPGSLVTQREVGVDVHTFADGLKYGLRQDPDVILVGEIRDHETAQMALSAAETGHLVFSTLHTRDAKGAVSRYIDLFPQTSQDNVRTQLAMSLRAIVSQHLVPSTDPTAKRELALEVVLANVRIAAAIQQNKLASMDNVILTSRADGMITFDDSLLELCHQGRIDRQTAQHFMNDPSRL